MNGQLLSDEEVFADNGIMAANAEAGLPMHKLMPLVRSVIATPTHNHTRG